jgi:PAS domain S-box-containing protein
MVASVTASRTASLWRSFSLAEKCFTGGFAAALLLLPLAILLTLQEANGSSARRHAEEISSAITGLRSYYASNVVARLQQSGGQAVFSERYRDVHGGIPIPATFSIEMGALFSRTHQDTSLRFDFVSDHPYPARSRPPLDAFQQRALAAFRADPRLESFSDRQTALSGHVVHRHATPVVMQAACVACHNTHPESPKRDWTVGDVRGIQDVGARGLVAGMHDYRYLFYYFGALTVLGAGAVAVFRRIARSFAQSNLELEAARRSQAQAASELSEKVDQLSLLGAVADNSAFGITIADARRPDLPLIYANEAFLRLTGYERDAVIGRNCRFLVGPQTRPEAVEGLRAAIGRGEVHTVELQNHRRDGSSFWNRLTVFPVGGVPGRPHYYVGYQVDTTAIHRAQAENAAMLNEIQEAKKLESLGILVAGVAHEINNPLGIAITASSHASQSAEAVRRSLSARGLLEAELADFLEDEKEAFDLVETNLRRAATLVRGFRDVAADRSQQSRREIDLRQYLETLAGTFVPLMRTTRCELAVEAPGDIRVCIDTGAFGQLITNLVVNATVHAFQGVAKPRIRLVARRDGATVSVVVEDNGTGIPAAVLPNLFTPFFTTRRADGGTGLGLFISRRIAQDAFGGSLFAEPADPTGTRMVFTFSA